MTLPKSGDPGQLVTVTVKDYDLSETSKLVRSCQHVPRLLTQCHVTSFGPPTWVSP